MSYYIKGFCDWVDDDSYIDDYKYHSIPDYHVLFRIFLYQPPVEKLKVNILNSDGSSASKKKREVLVPYAKVIKTGKSDEGFFSNIKPGDIVGLTDELTQLKINPQFEMWKEIQKERPKPDMPEPPQFIGFISNWFRYQFLISKLEDASSENDIMDMTFCVPQSFIKCKIEKEFFERYKTDEVIKP